MSFIPSVNRFIPSYPQSERRLSFESRLSLWLGADRENRTPDSSLARTRFTTKPYPLGLYTLTFLLAHQHGTTAGMNSSLAEDMCFLSVPPPGFEPGTTVPKTVVISISPQRRYGYFTTG